MNTMMIYVPIIMAIIGLLFMAIKRSWVLKQDAGDGKMKEISDYIYEGALAFLKSRIPIIDLLCYWSKCCFGWNYFIAWRNNTFINSSCLYFRSFFLCFSRKYGNENRNKN